MNLLVPALRTVGRSQFSIAAANMAPPNKLDYRDNLWRLWSDSIVHHIHARVFRHIQQLAEHDAQAMAVKAGQ